MDKFTFIIRQLAKTNKKNFENYVVTRIWHRLNNLDVKFITQQYIVRPEGYALTDMYFPQLHLHIEVDEPHHKKQIDADLLREQDIIGVTNHQFIRVEIDNKQGIAFIHAQIEAIVKRINEMIALLGDQFIPWDLNKELSPETYINRGYIELQDNVAFNRIADACNCFGHTYSGFQRGGTFHPVEEKTLIWFPKLFPNGEWDNRISSDECTITERNIDAGKAKIHIHDHIAKGVHRRIIFAKVKGPLGDIMYRFKGFFELDVPASTNCLVWRKVSDRVKTYKPKC